VAKKGELERRFPKEVKKKLVTIKEQQIKDRTINKKKTI